MQVSVEEEINQGAKLHLWDKAQNNCFMQCLLKKLGGKMVKMYMGRKESFCSI